MHIPDSFLDLKTTLATTLVSGAVLTVAVRRVNEALTPERVPLMGLAAAFVFTAQLFSFPIPGGTSTHLNGVFMMMVILGPATGLLLALVALFLQALMFQHGGLLTLGANFFNLGIVGSLLSYSIYRILPGPLELKAGLAAALGILMASLAVGVELAVSGTTPLSTTLPAMSIAGVITGIIEGLVTISVLRLMKRVAPHYLGIDKI
jgi:cobalt/nickel transport system permease protein